ncbi:MULTISPECIES: restriction endonuclease subunit R [Staphylococcus]|nr:MULTISPECIES: restriction endonuclease subunit R [Staphylococcus]HAR3680258.1 restriction endonuclease subunit R [Staphylococcus aureus]OFQ09484.1 restriction endonuclease subunit R [Staphylococcus sp. HMSC072E01]PNZ84681.1 restriction endonuclease subunit R [Staphylococcus petrasii]TGA81220.1 restriction endonuclease subunit R [Staphylococcus petrasii]SUM58670.1 Type I restriction-modification system,restriction subunit R [Staphylococcus petrasii]
MAYQSEYALENEVLQQLEELGYERVNIHNTESEINEYLKELGALKHV